MCDGPVSPNSETVCGLNVLISNGLDMVTAN